jgi:hypothetical protein
MCFWRWLCSWNLTFSSHIGWWTNSRSSALLNIAHLFFQINLKMQNWLWDRGKVIFSGSRENTFGQWFSLYLINAVFILLRIIKQWGRYDWRDMSETRRSTPLIPDFVIGHQPEPVLSTIHGFDPRSGHGAFVVGKVPLGQIFSEYFDIPCKFSFRSWVHPTSYPMGTGGSFPRVKRSGREADRSLADSGEVKKMWIYAFTFHTLSWHSA